MNNVFFKEFRELQFEDDRNCTGKDGTASCQFCLANACAMYTALSRRAPALTVTTQVSRCGNHANLKAILAVNVLAVNSLAVDGAKVSHTLYVASKSVLDTLLSV